jgi:hypothetical protein
MERRTHDRDDASEGAANGEHWFAWLLALSAIVLAAIGLLVGFGIIGGGDANTVTGGVADTTSNATANWQEGLLWLLPAIAMGLLAHAFHNTEHHRSNLRSTDEQSGLFNAEHSLAYVMALATIAAAALGLLVGFDVFDNGNIPQDGFLWETAAITGGVLTATLHTVRHHQYEDEAYIVSVIERRGAMMTDGERGTVRERRTERS